MFAQEPEYEVISTTTTAPRVRSTAELDARIRAAGGALTVDGQASEYIVAANNPLRYSVRLLGDNRVQISFGLLGSLGDYLPYILAGAGLLLAVSLIKR